MRPASGRYACVALAAVDDAELLPLSDSADAAGSGTDRGTDAGGGAGGSALPNLRSSQAAPLPCCSQRHAESESSRGTHSFTHTFVVTTTNRSEQALVYAARSPEERDAWRIAIALQLGQLRS